MSSTVNAVAHGFVVGDRFYFGNVLPEDTGIVEGQIYYVLFTGLTANAFKFSETDGGPAVTLAANVTECVLSGAAVYTAVTDPDDVHAPPIAPDAPGSCVLTSTAGLAPDGTVVTRLNITITQPTSATLRHTIVTVTGGSNVVKVVIPVGQTTGSIASVVPGVSFVGTAISYDTFGLASAVTTSAAHVAAGDAAAPSTPTSPAAAAGILMNLVSWTGVTDDDLDHYELAVSTNGGGSFPTVHTVYTTVVALSNLTAGTAYVYKVRAVDHTGNASAYTSTVTATPRQVTGSGLSGTDIAALSIAGADIKANTITAAKIAAGTITANEISADTITAGNIAASAITSSELAANAVIAGKIAAGTIVTGDLNATCSISLVSNSGATVVINSSGITISNGALVLQDEFGKTVLGASGFSGSWYDFVRVGLYNARFLQGSGLTGIAVGRTAAMPYWTLAKTVGSPTLDHVANDGLRINWAAVNNAVTALSDKVPCLPERKYQVPLTIKTASVTLITLSCDVFWYKADGTASSTPSTNAPFRAASVSFSGTGTTSYEMDPVVAPLDARFAAVKITLTDTLHTGGSTTTLNAVGLREANAENLSGQDLWIGAGTLELDGLLSGTLGGFTVYTPTVGNAGTLTWTTRTGAYIQIGPLVFVTVELVVNAAGAGGGTLTVSLPVNADTSTSQLVPCQLGGTAITNGAGVAVITSGGGAGVFAAINGGGVNLARADLTNADTIRIEGWYRAA
jgi:hypothetical protein